MDYGVPRKSVALEWQKDLLRFSVNIYLVPKIREGCVKTDTPSCILCLSLRSGIGVITVLQRYYKGIV